MIDNPRSNLWNFAILAPATLMGLAWLAVPASTHAQAPPGPLPQVQSQDAPPPPAPRPQAQKPAVQPRTSILGEWKLDRDESDDPRKKMQEARSQTQNRQRKNDTKDYADKARHHCRLFQSQAPLCSNGIVTVPFTLQCKKRSDRTSNGRKS